MLTRVPGWVFIVPYRTRRIRTRTAYVASPMDMIATCRRLAPCAAASGRDAAALLTRLTIGQAFAQTGWGKLHHLDGTIEYFTSLGIPLANVQAPMVATLEFVGGLALVLGLGTRAFAFLLSGTMLVAIVTAHWSEFLATLRPWPEAGLTEIDPWMYGLGLLWLIVAGPGRASLDHLIARRWCREKVDVAAKT